MCTRRVALLCPVLAGFGGLCIWRFPRHACTHSFTHISHFSWFLPFRPLFCVRPRLQSLRPGSVAGNNNPFETPLFVFHLWSLVFSSHLSCCGFVSTQPLSLPLSFLHFIIVTVIRRSGSSDIARPSVCYMSSCIYLERNIYLPFV